MQVVMEQEVPFRSFMLYSISFSLQIPHQRFKQWTLALPHVSNDDIEPRSIIEPWIRWKMGDQSPTKLISWRQFDIYEPFRMMFRVVLWRIVEVM